MLKNFFKSEIHRNIIRFFHENPASVDTARGVSTWIGQDLGKVRTALGELARAGVLLAHKATSTTGYSYTRNKRKISTIERFFKKIK